jgi:hypothetical protein
LRDLSKTAAGVAGDLRRPRPWSKQRPLVGSDSSELQSVAEVRVASKKSIRLT